ncbi:Crp/Fnr family transcriptional regulator [Aureisphaera galaxeae]|uniref:Crp/Fnr family transcriptional regulator n=1 Tax=Aureisphaera galaxeae TaxID=1538023 RepID=UPI0023506637|nr:Crp/Fnr family transcriptional regulator [Aureisphaera galaxeae]MDC8004657.1 Crp/Fnr family transcriptional regulator [Aureisphaera galaxeae]
MNPNPILNNIKRYVSLTPEDEQDFIVILEQKQISRKEFVVQPGQVCHHQTYVFKGALRSYFMDPEGQEHTIQFAIEDWFISDFNSYISQTPAMLYVEALEPTVVQQIEYHKVEALCRRNPKFERYFRVVAQKAFAYAQRRVLSNLEHTAEDRFRMFNTMYPEIVQRVPQYALASYLGMSAEFLSKVRKRMALKSD